MTKGIRSKIGLVLAIIMVLSLSLAACNTGGGDTGGGGDSGQTAPPPSDSGSAPEEEAAPPAPANTGEVFTVRIGCATVLPSHPNWFMEELKTALEAKSDQFKVELYPANQLGTNAEMIQGLQNGNVQGVVLPSGLFTSIAPVFVVLSVCGLIPGADAQYEMLNGTAVGDAIKAEVAKTGVTPLGFLWCPNQEIYVDKEVTDMAGLKGLKIRGSDAKIVQDTMSAYGASPVVMSSGDVVMGLQQGTINGLFTDVTFVTPMKTYEKAKYCLKDLPGLPNSNTIMVSNLFLDSLPPDLLEIFTDTVTEVRERTHEYTIGYENDCYTEMVANGGVILTPSDAFMAEINEKNIEVAANFATDYIEFAEFYALIAKYVSENIR